MTKSSLKKHTTSLSRLLSNANIDPNIPRTSSPIVREQVISRARNRENILSVLIIGTFSLAALICLSQILSYIFMVHVQSLGKAYGTGFTALVSAVILLTRYRVTYQLTCYALIGLYGSAAIAGMWLWGTNLQFSLLIFTLAIIVSGILLGSRAVAMAATFVVISVALVQVCISIGLNPHSDRIGFNAISIDDAFSYVAFFVALSGIIWLFGSQLERSLERAYTAENELHKEKDRLAKTLIERTKKLHEANKKEVKQLYKFAELGQVSALLLHNLTNHLALLTLDIEDVKQQRSQAIINAQESISHIEVLVDQVRAQIHDSENPRAFGVTVAVSKALQQLDKQLKKHAVHVKVQNNVNSDQALVFGDPTRLAQVLTVLIGNALDAIAADNGINPNILIQLEQYSKRIMITVHDWGLGIKAGAHKELFEPFKSTKPGGMGVGLYIAKEIITTHFNGTLRHDDTLDHTAFVLIIPIHTN